MSEEKKEPWEREEAYYRECIDAVCKSFSEVNRYVEKPLTIHEYNAIVRYVVKNTPKNERDAVYFGWDAKVWAEWQGASVYLAQTKGSTDDPFANCKDEAEELVEEIKILFIRILSPLVNVKWWVGSYNQGATNISYAHRLYHQAILQTLAVKIMELASR